MGQAGIGEKLACGAVVLVVNQNPARQDAELTFDHAHVLVQHHMMDIGAVEQRADRRDQHDIIGPNQFPQNASPSSMCNLLLTLRGSDAAVSRADRPCRLPPQFLLWFRP